MTEILRQYSEYQIARTLVLKKYSAELSLHLTLKLVKMLIIKLLFLFSGALTKSQFPVFTIYAQKSCLGVKPCEKSWCIDRVQDHRLVGFAQSHQIVHTRQECLELCLGETDFTCRSVLLRALIKRFLFRNRAHPLSSCNY